MTLSINKWAASFLDELRKFYCSEDFLFVSNNASGEFGVASTNAKLLYHGDDKMYFTNDFERPLTKFWNSSNVHNWTRIKLYYSGRILWSATEVIYGLHMCSTTCIIKARRESATKDVVKNSHCIYLEDRVVKTRTHFAKNFYSKNISVLLEMNEKTTLEFSLKVKLCFKKLTGNAKAPRRATDGSVGYDLYAAKEAVVWPLSHKLIRTDIALSCPPGLYPPIAPRFSLACKNKNVGAAVIDVDYRGNVKVLMLNHSQGNFNIELGDRIAQFILTRYETPDAEEVDESVISF